MFLRDLGRGLDARSESDALAGSPNAIAIRATCGISVFMAEGGPLRCILDILRFEREMGQPETRNRRNGVGNRQTTVRNHKSKRLDKV
jgi:hypothetical protein